MRRFNFILFSSIPILLSLIYLPWNVVYGKVVILIALELIIIAGSFFDRKLLQTKLPSTIIILTGVYVGANLLSFIFSLDPQTSLIGSDPRYSGLLPQLGGIFLFVFLLYFEPRLKDAYKILRWYLLPPAILVIFGVVQFFLDIPLFEKHVFDGRVDSFLSNPNTFALYLLIHIPLFIYLWKQEQLKILKKVLYPGLLFLFACGLFITGSRTAFFIFILECVVFISYFVFVQRKMLFALVTKNMLKILGIGFLIMLSLYATPRELVHRYSLAPASIVSLETRVTVWKDTLTMIRERPWFGFGHDQFRTAFNSYSSSALLKNPLAVDRAHNLFLDMIAEKGIMGLSLFILLVGFVVYNALRNLSSMSTDHRYFTISLLVSLTSYFLFLQLNFTDIVNESYFWILLGFLYVATTRPDCKKPALGL